METMKMWAHILICIATIIYVSKAVQFPVNSEMTSDDKNVVKEQNKTLNHSEPEDSHEVELVEKSSEDGKDKELLQDAMITVLDPTSVIIKDSDIIQDTKNKLEKLDKDNMTLNSFMESMDDLSLNVCKQSHEALWSYVTDINNESKKNFMVRIVGEEDQLKKQYWETLKKKYLHQPDFFVDPKLRRKFRIIREKAINLQLPQSMERKATDDMQKLWGHASVCAYNAKSCDAEDSSRTMSDILTIFKSSSDAKELAYYWKAYRDATGKKIRPIFPDYIIKMNNAAEIEQFLDAGDLWRSTFEDEHFVETVDRIWSEIKPLYHDLREYVELKLKLSYQEDYNSEENTIPAHLLGHLWGQEWQAIFPKVVAYPSHYSPINISNHTVESKYIFGVVDGFHQSLGFDSAKESYQGIDASTTTTNCLPSSYDMCDGVNYKIKWCGDKVTDLNVALTRASRLLGHVQYFKHYRNLSPLFRDAPNPAFFEALSDIAAVQLTNPNILKKLNIVELKIDREANLNHLLWIALEKIPVIAYAYVLDKWRWDVFANSSIEQWNKHWWDLRTKETGIAPPVPRNESDLDPASKYHVVSHIQYITYLISNVLEFQILLSLCKAANHLGPLHECSIHNVKEAGTILSNGMSLGASEDWRTVLKVMTGETELSTEGILLFFAPLREFLQNENIKLNKLNQGDMDQSTPIIVGVIVIILTVIIILLYCLKKHNVGGKFFSVCGLSKNGSLDIVTDVAPQSKSDEVCGISEDKV